MHISSKSLLPFFTTYTSLFVPAYTLSSRFSPIQNQNLPDSALPLSKRTFLYDSYSYKNQADRAVFSFLLPTMSNSLQSDSPPIPLSAGFRTRPLPLLHSSSPLNPNHGDNMDLKPMPASAHPISTSNLRRMSNASYSRRGSAPATPTRFSPRSPLAFLSNSPSSSVLSTGSSLSSIGWPRTPPQSPFSHITIALSSPSSDRAPMVPSSPGSAPMIQKSHIPAPINLSPPSSRSSVSIDVPSPMDNRPAYIKRRHDLDIIPPSPPIMDPAYLLEHDPAAHLAGDRSIASPFHNLDMPPTYMPHSDRAVPSRRASSGLSREFSHLEMVDKSTHPNSAPRS